MLLWYNHLSRVKHSYSHRIAGQDWQFANVTANDTYQFVGPWTTGVNLTEATAQKTFEMRGNDSISDVMKDIANLVSDQLGLWISDPLLYSSTSAEPILQSN